LIERLDMLEHLPAKHEVERLAGRQRLRDVMRHGMVVRPGRGAAQLVLGDVQPDVAATRRTMLGRDRGAAPSADIEDRHLRFQQGAEVLEDTSCIANP